VFYRSAKGTIYAGATDLVHAAEGYGRYTMGGAANQAAQWADKALEVMHTTRDPEQFGKYLKRLRDEMKMARARSHLPEGTLAPAFDRLEKLIQMSGSEGAAIFDNPLTQQALRSTQAEAVFLRRLAGTPPGPARDLMIAALIDAPGPWAKAGEQLRVLSEGTYEAVTLDRVMTGLMVYLGTKEVARKAGAEGLESALRQAGVRGRHDRQFPRRPDAEHVERRDRRRQGYRLRPHHATPTVGRLSRRHLRGEGLRGRNRAQPFDRGFRHALCPDQGGRGFRLPAGVQYHRPPRHGRRGGVRTPPATNARPRRACCASE